MLFRCVLPRMYLPSIEETKGGWVSMQIRIHSVLCCPDHSVMVITRNSRVPDSQGRTMHKTTTEFLLIQRATATCVNLSIPLHFPTNNKSKQLQTNCHNYHNYQLSELSEQSEYSSSCCSNCCIEFRNHVE